MKMKNLKSWMVWLGGLICLQAAMADEAILFSAAVAGPDVWVWEGAKLTANGGKLILARAAGDVSDVYLQDHFAYTPDASFDVDVDSVSAGATYSVQLLAFKGATYLGAVDLLTDTAQVGLRTFQLGELPVPEGTETVTFKLWISQTIGSSVIFNELKYYEPIDPARIVYDQRIESSTTVIPEQVRWAPSDNGGWIELQTNTSVGSIVFPNQIERLVSGTLVIDVADVKNGTLTAQLCVFNSDGVYLSSIDLVEKATGSMSVPLKRVVWPEGASTFQLKLWLGGSSGASATIKRVLILK